jgi:hypothetical protein
MGIALDTGRGALPARNDGKLEAGDLDPASSPNVWCDVGSFELVGQMEGRAALHFLSACDA